MQILIAHPSPPVTIRLRNQLMDSAKVSSCVTAVSLTDTYNFAEHHQPDCVLLASTFAARPEFELIDTLFSIIGIGCVLIQDSDKMNSHALSRRAKEHIILGSEPSDPAILLQAVQVASQQAAGVVSASAMPDPCAHFDPRRVILIGASTGGVDALLKTTQDFTDRCPPTVIVQHTGGRFAKSLIRLLDRATRAHVMEAQHGSSLQPGHIYLPPDDAAHLCIETGKTPRLSLQARDAVSGHRPSVDALFTSAIPYATHVTAALLTGMGRDGAQGLTALRQAGAHTIGQDQETSVVYGMPRVAKEMGGVANEMPLEKIGPALLAASSKQARI